MAIKLSGVVRARSMISSAPEPTNKTKETFSIPFPLISLTFASR